MNDDLISRKAAIEALYKEYHGMISDEGMKIYEIIHWLDSLPTAQPEILACGEGELVIPKQRWIPVTEWLPEIDMSYPHHEDYLVQYDSGGMDVASWSNTNRFWTDHVTEPHWNCVQFAEVVAWMPIEPWKGENDG